MASATSLSIFDSINEELNSNCTCSYNRLETEEICGSYWYRTNIAKRIISSLAIGPVMLYIVWRLELFVTALVCGVLVAISNFEYYWIMRRLEMILLSHGKEPLVNLVDYGNIPQCQCHSVLQFATPHIFTIKSSSLAISSCTRFFRLKYDFITTIVFGLLSTGIVYVTLIAVEQFHHFPLKTTVVHLKVYCCCITFFTFLFAAHTPSKIDALNCVVSQGAYSVTVINSLLCTSSVGGCTELLDLLYTLTLGAVASVTLRVFSTKDAMQGTIRILMDLLGLVYICAMLAVFSGFIDHPDEFSRRQVILSFLHVVWCSDSAAFIVGKIIIYLPWHCSHKLASHLSPNKDIEGTLGALVGAVGGIYLSSYFFGLSGSHVKKILFAIVGCIVGRVGDLFESMIKRSSGVKDSSDLIPGHGGLLDRIDALLFVAVVFSMY